MAFKKTDYPKEAGIYRWYNRATGRSYVGSSGSIRVRAARHLWELRDGRSHGTRLQAAWKKYGEDAFELQVLELGEPAALLRREGEWIARLDSVRHGYNCLLEPAAPRRGIPVSEETRAKYRAAQSCRTLRQRQAAAATMRGYNQSLKGRAKSPEHRAKISAANKGRTLAEAARAAMRERVWTPEQRAKFCGRTVSSETRRKMSAAATKRRGPAAVRNRAVVQKTAGGKIVAQHISAAEAARTLGIGAGAIRNCLCGLSNKAGGFVWSYV